MITLVIDTIDENPNFIPQNSQNILSVTYTGNIDINIDCTYDNYDDNYDHSKTGIKINNIISDIGEWTDQHGYVNSKKHQLNINVTYTNLNMFNDNFTFEPPVVTLPEINSIALRYNINIQFKYTDQFLDTYGFTPTKEQLSGGIYKLLTYHLPDEELPQGWDIPGITPEKIAYRRDKKINISKLLNLNTSIKNQVVQNDQHHYCETVLVINFSQFQQIHVDLSNYDPANPDLSEMTHVNNFNLQINAGEFSEGRVPYCFDMDDDWNLTYNIAGNISESIYKQWQHSEQLQNDIKNYAKYAKSSTNHTKFTIDLSNYENTYVSYGIAFASKDNTNNKEYGIAVDWGDGVKQPFIPENISISCSHIYRQGGVYTIDIIGDIEIISSINYGNFLTEILELPMTLTAFRCYEYSNLVTFSADIPSSITDYTSFFRDCTSLSNIPENFTIPNTVSGCAEMFYNCLSLETIPAIKLPDTITNASSMFQKCQRLQALDLEFSDNCENISNICKSCTSLQSVTINKLPDINNLNCQFAFADCTNLGSISIKTSNLSMAFNVNYWGMFQNCYTLYDINFISEQNPLPSIVSANYTRMFYNCTALAINCTGIFNNWTDSLNIDVTEMFAYCYNIQGQLYHQVKENDEWRTIPSPLITNTNIHGVDTMFAGSISEHKILQDQTNLQLLQQNGYYTQV